MKWIDWGNTLVLALAASLPTAYAATTPIPISVDCSQGQSLNRTLSNLDNHLPYSISVSGSCAEYVQVVGFQNLRLKGLSGANLLQPNIAPSNLTSAVLAIESSQSVTVDGLNVQAETSGVQGILIDHGSSDIRLRNLTVRGGIQGILVAENSQVSLAYVTGEDPSYTPLGIYDSSDVHVEHCVFENSTGQIWHVGMDLGASHVTLYETTIKNMQVGINAYAGSVVDVQAFDTYYPFGGSPVVTIASPAGTNFEGVSLSGGSHLNVTGPNQQATKLLINQPGQAYGGTTAGVLVSDGSVLEANSNLVITGSYGQGVLVLNNSHATITGVTVTGSGHGGLVAANLSSIDGGGGSTPSLIGGNGVDLFCDSDSTITGGANLASAHSTQCANLLAAEAALP
jgi:hypothetical protein